VGIRAQLSVPGTLLALALQVYGQTGRMKQVVQNLDTAMEWEVANHSFRGTVLVGIRGETAFEKAHGLANEEWGIRNTLSTKFLIASLTKQFTAACILLLQERGRLSVHDPISMHLPDLPEAWRPLTIHQLLTRTSGIPNYPGDPQIKQLNRTGATPREMIGLVARKPLEFEPGTKFAYTNTGYILLGMIIENVPGLSYSDFL
jgi:CubicO group peptidase (beta-lactamase class C family)